MYAKAYLQPSQKFMVELLCKNYQKLYFRCATGFYDGGAYHKETSPLANEWISFYIIGSSAIKELPKKV